MSIAELFDAHRARFADFLNVIDTYADDLARIGADNPPEPRWGQDWFPRLDACAAYAMVREHSPAQIVEIGSGHSTRFMARAIRDGALQTRLTSIDPQPRATLDGLRIERIAERVQDATIPTLASGDILFIDSSHIVSPGSDVDHLIGRIVPTLPAGALVHIHDIFLPDPYPAAWDYRRYNEQDVVGALLESGTSQLLFASRYVSTRMADDMARTCLAKIPLWMERSKAACG